MPNQTADELRRLIDNMLAFGQKPTRALRKRYRRARRREGKGVVPEKVPKRLRERYEREKRLKVKVKADRA